MSGQVHPGFMADISEAIIVALRGPKGTEIATLAVRLANDAEIARLAAITKARAEFELAGTLRDMLVLVAEQMGVTPESMVGKGRTQTITRARAVFAHLARENTCASLKRVGQELGGQDHTTIVHSSRRGAELISTDERARTAAAKVAERWNTGHVDGLPSHG